MLATRIALPKGVVRHSRKASERPCLALHSKSTRCLEIIHRSQSTLSPGELTREPGADRGSGPAHGRIRRNHRQGRFPKHLRVSPNAILAQRLRDKSPLTWTKWKDVREIAASRSLRLPVVTLQMLLRKDEAELQTSLSENLCSPAEWRARLNSLAFKGVSEGDINQWLWILSAENPDERIERFTSTDGPKPIFLLLQLLKRDETFQKGKSLTLLLDYILRHHVRPRNIPPDAQLAFGAVRRSLDSGLNMTPDHFSRVLRLLVHHYLRLWPSGLPSVARLVSLYIETIPFKTKEPEAAYAQSCSLFNYALTLFQQKSPINPLLSMQNNWRAQKVLLALSTTTPRPLQFSRDGFVAVRRVMLALGKSPAERKVAARLAKTWPPYRREWDGLDERRRPEDDLSRSVRAGTLMQEAGYASNEHDHALGVLGGAVLDESPTVVTRSLSPRTWNGSKTSLNVYSTWAARVKATRDVNEAWHQFKSSPDGRITPNFQVYAEMFRKLFAASVDPSRPGLPGDSKEVFAVHDLSLSAFEKERVSPPSATELYSQMLRNGNRPVQGCLNVLVQNASSLEAAFQYLNDSPLDKKAISTLKPLEAKQPQFDGDAAGSLQKIPLPTFNTYIALLCRLQSGLNARASRAEKLQRIALINHAIGLCALRLPPNTPWGRTYKAPWHNIMRTLAARNVLVSKPDIVGRRFHDIEAFSLFMKVFTSIREIIGVDIVLFDSLCKATQKALRWKNTGDATALGEMVLSSEDDSHPREAALLQAAHDAVVTAFHEMTTGASAERRGDDPLSHPTLAHRINPAHLHGYVRVLGYLGDMDEMVRAMEWIMRAWDDETVLEEAKDMDHDHHAAMERVFVMFRAFAENQISAELFKRLEDKSRELGKRNASFWRWPTKEEADVFAEWDGRDYRASFWTRVRPLQQTT